MKNLSISPPKSTSGYFLTPLRYPGGKGRLGPWLAQIVDANDLKGGWYVEPYAGGAGAALYLLAQKCVDHVVINDVDPVIHAFWMAVTKQTDDFVSLVRRTRVSMAERQRQQEVIASPKGRSTLALGFAAFFLNRTSRSGILSGGVIGGKAQAGEYKLDARYNKDNLIDRIRYIGSLSSQITVLGLDALDLLKDYVPRLSHKKLVYLDPPYFQKGSQLYSNYYEIDDHLAIANLVRKAKYPVLVTYDNCAEIRDLYPDIATSTFSLQYSTHLARPSASEVMLYSNLSIPCRPQLTRGSAPKRVTKRHTNSARDSIYSV